MSRKNSNDQGFGDLEDDFFNSGPSDWEAEEAKKLEAARLEEESRRQAEVKRREEAAAAAKRAEEEAAAKKAAAAEEARVAAAAKAEEARVAAAAKAEEARVAAAAKAEEDARKSAEAARQREEDARQAELEAEARNAARKMKDQATRVFKRKSREEILAEEDAAEALVERPSPVEEAPAVAEVAAPPAVVEAVVEEAPAEPVAESASMVSIDAPDESPPPPVLMATPTVVPEAEPELPPALPLLSLLPQLGAEEAMETEVVSAPATEEMPAAANLMARSADSAAGEVAMLAWTPPSDARAAWKLVVDELEAAADAASGEARATLLGAAAHLARTRCVDSERASTLAAAVNLEEAPAVASWWRERAAVALAAGDGESARLAFEGLARNSSGGAAAEAWVVAARIVRDQLGQEQLALAELQRARSAQPTQPAVLLVLRELARVAQDPALEVSVLESLGSLQPAELAGQTHLERAEILERKLNQPEEALAATQAARDADPQSGAAFLALERRLRAAGAWAGLAELYLQEGERLQIAGLGEDAAWWFARSGRVRRVQLLDEAAAGVALRKAVLAAPAAPDLRREYHVWCAEAEQWAALVESLREEIAVSPVDAQSFLQYRLGNVLEERLGDTEGALAAYRAAATDPGAAPAAEAVLRLLQASGAWADLVAFLEARLERLDDPSLMVTVLYRMGETCEGPLANQEGARARYERVLDYAPGYLPALEGLERVYTRLSAWAELAAIYEQRALLAEDPNAIALQRHRAGAVYEFRLSEHARAHEQYRLALAAVPDFAPSLDAYSRAMEAADQWAELARALRNASNATRDSNEAVSLAYRAGRVLADRTDLLPEAMASLQHCLDLSPGFLPAVLLLKELAARQGDWSLCFRLERSQAEMSEDLGRRHWRLYAAAEAAQRLPDADPAQLVREVLREDQAHFGASQLAERMAWSQSDVRALVDLLVKRGNATQDEAERARCFARASELAADAGNAEVLLSGIGEVLTATGVSGRPLAAIARVAETAGYPEEALRALQEAGAAESVDAARLRQHALGDAEGAVRILAAVLEAGDNPVAASLLVRLSSDAAVRARAHAVLSRTAANEATRALHATEAAVQLESMGDSVGALAMWWSAFEAEPRSGRAFDGLRNALIRGQDSEALRKAYALLDADAAMGLGDALEEAGDVVGAVAAWRACLASSAVKLPWLLRLERGLETAGDWQGLLSLLQSRMATAEGATAEALASRTRWLLAEKLADTEDAWECYRELHRQRPDDAEVLEALARIAAARGEQTLAVGYLDQLSQQAGSPDDGARLQRRRAEVMERLGDNEGARAAFTRALDFVHDDREALSGLERLAAAAGDWQGVVGVLARQAALGTGREQVELAARIARTWEEKIGDAPVAMDAWRKVIELAPEDREALARLCSLTEAAGDWSGFVEHGRGLAAHLTGPERSTLLRRLGEVSAQQLRRDDDALRFLESATTGAHADPAAFVVYERLLASRGDQPRLVDVLLRRARASTAPEEKMECLARAARIRLDTLQDKPGAAAIFDELLTIDPNQADALRFRGDYLFDTGDVSAAAAMFARLEPAEMEAERDDFDEQIEGSSFFFRFAEALRRSGRPQEAIARYEQALTLNPTHLPSLEAVGPLFLDAKDWVKAERVFKQVMQLTGGQGQSEQIARTYARLGVAEFHLGHVERARKRLSKALELRANDVDALKGLGLVMVAQKDWNNLLNIYNNIIYHTHEPSDVTDAYLAKALVLDVHLGMPEKAAQHYEKSLAFDPAQPQAVFRLAELALRKRDWPEAATQVDRAEGMETSRTDVLAALQVVRAIACQACGDAAAAQEAWALAVKVDAALVAQLPAEGLDDHDRVHEALRTRIVDGQL